MDDKLSSQRFESGLNAKQTGHYRFMRRAHLFEIAALGLGGTSFLGCTSGHAPRPEQGSGGVQDSGSTTDTSIGGFDSSRPSRDADSSLVDDGGNEPRPGGDAGGNPSNDAHSVVEASNGATGGSPGSFRAVQGKGLPLSMAIDGMGRVSVVFGSNGEGGVRVYETGAGLLASFNFPEPLAVPQSSYNWIKDISADKSGDIVYAGTTDGVFAGEAGKQDRNFDCVVGKLSREGTKLWVHTFGTNHALAGRGDCGATFGLSISVDPLGNVLVVGYSGIIPGQLDTSHDGQYATNGGLFVAKYTSGGARSWITQFGPEDGSSLAPGDSRARSVATDDSGNVYVAGDWFYSPRKSFIAKFSPDGQSIWQTVIQADPHSVSVSDDGNAIYVEGSTKTDFSKPTGPAFSTPTAFVAKFAGSGKLLWSQYSVANRDPATCVDPSNCPASVDTRTVVSSPDGGAVYVAGDTTGYFPTDANPAPRNLLNCFAMKLDGTGVRSWIHQYIYPIDPSDSDGAYATDMVLNRDMGPLLLGNPTGAFFIAALDSTDGAAR